MSVVISFHTREREALPPAPPPAPLATPVRSSNIVHIERLSAGPRRSFWVCQTFEQQHKRGITSGGWPTVTVPPLADLTPEIIESIVRDLAALLPENAAGPLVIERQTSAYRSNGETFWSIDLCVCRGRWRTRTDLCLQLKLPDAIREQILSLPHSVDSWTEEQETKAKAEEADARALGAKLSKVRRLLRERPEAWPAVESVLDNVLGRGAM